MARGRGRRRGVRRRHGRCGSRPARGAAGVGSAAGGAARRRAEAALAAKLQSNVAPVDEAAAMPAAGSGASGSGAERCAMRCERAVRETPRLRRAVGSAAEGV
jgi:hypothetical protein